MIPLNDFKRQWADTRLEVLEAVSEVGESGWYILGRQVARFEAELARRCGAGHAVGVASGLDALEISLRALGCGPGDEVLTSPISAFATVLAILKLQAVPVFADCDEYGLVDLDACRSILKSRPGIRYFVPVHLYGHALDMGVLRELRDEFDLKIVEDCAQAMGARHRDVPVGAVGHMAAISFYPTKNLGAMGDGGAILTSDAGLAALVSQLRDYGQSGKYRHDVIGYNSRLDELQAAILLKAGLPRMDRWAQARARIAARYIEGIHNPRIKVPGPPAGSQSCWHLFPVLVEDKAAFRTHLEHRGVATGEHYPLALVEQKPIERSHDCPRARHFCHSEVSLPVHPYLDDTEIDTVIAACNSWW